MDMRSRGAGVGIDNDSSVVDRDIRQLQTEIRKPGAASGCHQHATTGNAQAIVELHGDIAWFTLQSRHGRVEPHFNALVVHALLHGIRQLGVKAAQQARTSHHLHHAHAEAAHDAGELTGDEAGAHDHDNLRKVGQLEHVVAHPAELDTGDLRPDRSTADSDQHPGSLKLRLHRTTSLR